MGYSTHGRGAGVAVGVLGGAAMGDKVGVLATLLRRPAALMAAADQARNPWRCAADDFTQMTGLLTAAAPLAGRDDLHPHFPTGGVTPGDRVAACARAWAAYGRYLDWGRQPTPGDRLVGITRWGALSPGSPGELNDSMPPHAVLRACLSVLAEPWAANLLPQALTDWAAFLLRSCRRGWATVTRPRAEPAAYPTAERVDLPPAEQRRRRHEDALAAAGVRVANDLLRANNDHRAGLSAPPARAAGRRDRAVAELRTRAFDFAGHLALSFRPDRPPDPLCADAADAATLLADLFELADAARTCDGLAGTPRPEYARGVRHDWSWARGDARLHALFLDATGLYAGPDGLSPELFTLPPEVWARHDGRALGLLLAVLSPRRRGGTLDPSGLRLPALSGCDPRAPDAALPAPDFGLLPILADALDEADCGDQTLLDHLRLPPLAHGAGCWALAHMVGQLHRGGELF